MEEFLNDINIMKSKSVKSLNPYPSLPVRQAGVILTFYDIVKAHGGELKVETKVGEGLPAGHEGSEFIIELPNG